ncbi:hypothetical protein MMC26_003877 [Xylographa opegraphella]|nr:hypothetical protein [Xylographa opegraphella]
MTDITQRLDKALSSHNAHVNQHIRNRLDVRDEFLREAYRINASVFSVYRYLSSIRQSYLSTSLPPHRNRLAISRTHSATTDRPVATHSPAGKDRQYFTDAQRDQIDAESKATLRDLNAGIRQLEEAEQLQRNTETTLAEGKRARYGLGALGRWAAGDMGVVQRTPEEALEVARQETIRIHRESVIWYLRKKLGEAAELQSAMMQTRLDREVEKSKSVLYKTRGAANRGSTPGDSGDTMDLLGAGGISGNVPRTAKHRSGPSAIDDGERKIEQTLSPEQVQQFAQENSDMLKHYEDTLDKVRTAERSMMEISELQTTLAANLETQSSMINDLVLDSLDTTDDIAGGNKELKRAADRKGPARWVFRATCGLCVFLVLWDLIF